MAFGTAIAALDVVLGLSGLDKVMGGLRSLDREMAKQRQDRAPQQIRVPGLERQVAGARAITTALSGASRMAANTDHALGRLQRALAAPTRNYAAAREAQDRMRAADAARVQIRNAQADVQRLRQAQTLASRDVGTAGVGVSNAVAGVRQARSDLGAVVDQERKLAAAFTQADRAARQQAATLTRLRSQQTSDVNKLSAAERAQIKQRAEIRALAERATAPRIQDEFSRTVTGSKLYERQAALAAKGKDTSAVEKEIDRNLTARTSAHQIAIEKMIRQENRYADAVKRAQRDVALTTAQLTGQRGVALSAMRASATARTNLNAYRPTVQAATARVGAAEAALATARLNRQNAVTARQAAGAAVQNAIAHAQLLTARLGPVLANGGTRAVLMFQNAMAGLNPVQWAANVLGAAGGVARSVLQNIGAVGATAFNALSVVGGVAFSVLRGGISVIGMIGSGLLGVGKLALNAAGAIASFVTSPLIATPLTGGLNLVIDHFGTIIKLIGGATAALAVFAAQQILTQGVSYEASISGVRAAAGYSPGMGNNAAGVEAQISRLSPIILKIGADTKYNNTEVAKGIETLLSGGLQVQQINMLTARSLFDVAAATNSSIDDSAKVIDSVVQLFKVPESQIVHAGDIIAGVVNSSLMDMAEFGSALRQLGPLATTMGISFEDTATALTVLAGAGFRGELGGTALRNMLIYLNPRSDKAASELKDAGLIDASGKNQFFDEKGNLKGFEDIFALLRGASKGMSDEDQLQYFTKVFGTRSASAAMVYAGLDPAKYGQTKGRIGQQSASGTADTRLANVAGSWEKLTGTLESLAAQVFMNWGAAPLKRFLDYLLGVSNKVYAFVGSTEGLTESYKGLFGLQPRASAFLNLIRQFVEAGSFLNGMNLTDLQIGLEAIFTSGQDAPMGQDTFRKLIVNPLIQVIRVTQLARDGVITFAQALRGQWGGALTSSINPVIRLLGIFGTYWGNLYRSIREVASGKISVKDFLGQLSGGFGRLLQEIGGTIDIEGPGLMERLKGIGKWLKDLGLGWWNEYLKPEIDLLWTNFTAWITERKPTFVAAWNDLWSSILGLKPPKADNPIEGFSLLGTGSAGQSADQMTSLGDIFNTLFDKGRDAIVTRGGPMLDQLLKILQQWWVDHQQDVFNVGKSIGQSFADGMTAAIKATIGPDWLQNLLVGMGAPQAVVDFIFPKKATGGTAPGVFGGRVPTRDPNGGSAGQSVDNAVGNAANAAGGFGRWIRDVLGVGDNDLAGLIPKDGEVRKLNDGKYYKWDDKAGKWNPVTAPAAGSGGGNPFLDPTPGTGGTPGSTVPKGTIPTGLPRTGGGGGGDVDLVALVQAQAAMIAQVLTVAMVPRQITIDGTGLTSVEFYQQLGSYLEQFFGGKTTGTPTAGDRSSLK